MFLVVFSCDILQEVVQDPSILNSNQLINNNLWQRFNQKSPISTSFDDAIYEAEYLHDFEPEEIKYRPLDIQPKASSGGYILRSGVYSMNAKSFCLRGYTHGPSRGDGHLYAPLKGKKADFIQSIIERYGERPEIPQQNVQVLLWAIIAGADMNTLGEQHSKTLNELFSVQELLEFQGRDWLNGIADEQINEFKRWAYNTASPKLRNLLEADDKIRTMVQQNKSFREIEKVAIIAGVAPRGDMIREVSKGRWSYHPDGFFVRFFPNGYSQTRVDVYVPYEGDLSFDKAGKPRLIENNLPEEKEVVFNPASMVATPANQSSQKIGVVPAPVEPTPPKEEPCIPETTGNLYPVIPSQEFKEYTKKETYKLYEPKDIDKFHPECKRGSPSSSNNHCFVTYTHYRMTMYSLYITDKGDFVKGHWIMEYREDDENMGTLLAKGNTIYPEPNSEFNEYYSGSTYAVSANEFHCISVVDANTINKIREYQRRVNPKEFKKEGKIYIRIDK